MKQNRFHPDQIAPKHLIKHINNDFDHDGDGPDLPKSSALNKKEKEKDFLNKLHAHNIISPSARTEFTAQNEKQTEEAVFKAHEYMQSDTDNEDLAMSEDETSNDETDDEIGVNEADPGGHHHRDDSDDPKIAKPETSNGTIFTFRPSKKLKSRPVPPRPISTTAAALPKPINTRLTPISGGKPSKGLTPTKSPTTPALNLSPITASKRERRLSEPDYGTIFNNTAHGYSHHAAHFSNQTECKLQQPISPILPQITPKLLQQSTQPDIDDNGNEIPMNKKVNMDGKVSANNKEMKNTNHAQNASGNGMVPPYAVIRNQSRNISVAEPDTLSRRHSKSTKRFGKLDIDDRETEKSKEQDGEIGDREEYHRGSIDNIMQSPPPPNHPPPRLGPNGAIVFNRGFANNGSGKHHSEMAEKINVIERKLSAKRQSKSKSKSKNKSANKKTKKNAKKKKKIKKPSLKIDKDSEQESICAINGCKCSTFIETTGWNIGKCGSCGHDEKDHNEILNRRSSKYKKSNKTKLKPIAQILQRKSKAPRKDRKTQKNGSIPDNHPKHRSSKDNANNMNLKPGPKRRSALVIGNESNIRKAKEKVTPKRASSYLPRSPLKPLPSLPLDDDDDDDNKDNNKPHLPMRIPQLSQNSVSEPNVKPEYHSLEVAKPITVAKAKRSSKSQKALKRWILGTPSTDQASPSSNRLSPNMSPSSGGNRSTPMSPMAQLTPPPAYHSPDKSNDSNSSWEQRPNSAKRSSTPQTPQMDSLRIDGLTNANPNKKRSKSTGNVVRQFKQQIRYTQKRKSTSPQTSNMGTIDTRDIHDRQISKTPSMRSTAYSAKSPPPFPGNRFRHNQYNSSTIYGAGTPQPPIYPQQQPARSANGYYQHYKNQFTYVSQYAPSPQPSPSPQPPAPNQQYNGHQYQHTQNQSIFNFPGLQGTIPPPPPSPLPTATDDGVTPKEDQDRKDNKPHVKRLKALKWDKALKKDKSKINTFIWGKINPTAMFPSYAYPITPWNCDNLAKKQIYNISVAKEGGHCFGIGANDWCFVWGEAQYIGVLGLGTNTQATTPFLVRSLRREKVKQTCCSAFHSLCITENMMIYGWGSKTLTLLGVDTNEPTPLQFLNGKGLKSLSACNTHSLAWNNKSIHVYSFGIAGPWLGFDDDNKHSMHKATFGIVKFDSYIYNKKFVISQADCSSQYSVILLNTGYVGVCGVNEHGRMGIGKHVVKSGKVLWMRDFHKIVRVSCASFHSGFVDTTGKVYTCGVGADHRLGHGDLESVWRPKLVESIENVKIREIECVADRTYVVSTAGHLILWGQEPLTKRTHFSPFLYNYLNSYRVFNVHGAKDFAIVQGMAIKQPLETPNIDGLNSSIGSRANKILGMASFLTNKKPLEWISMNTSAANTSVQTILPSSPQGKDEYNDSIYWNNNGNHHTRGNSSAAPMAFANGNYNNYQNPDTNNFKRHYYKNKMRKYKSANHVGNDVYENKYDVDDDKYNHHIYRQRSEVTTGYNDYDSQRRRKRHANRYGNAKSDKILGVTIARDSQTPQMDTDDELETSNENSNEHDSEEKREIEEQDKKETPRGDSDDDNDDEKPKKTKKNEKEKTEKDKRNHKDTDKKKKKRNFTTRLKRAKTDNYKSGNSINDFSTKLRRADTNGYKSKTPLAILPKAEPMLIASKSAPSPVPKMCSHAGCYCTKYVASGTSKWSKGKCKTCNHKQKEHNMPIPDPKYESEEEESAKRTYNYFPNHRFM